MTSSSLSAFHEHRHAQTSDPLNDPELVAYQSFLHRRREFFMQEQGRIREEYGSLEDYANLHSLLGMHKITDATGKRFWRLREWMPAASELWLTTDRTGFACQPQYMFQRLPQSSLKDRRAHV